MKSRSLIKSRHRARKSVGAFALLICLALEIPPASPAFAQWYAGFDAGPTFQDTAHVTAGLDNRTDYWMGAGMQAEAGYDFGQPKLEFQLGYRDNPISKIGKMAKDPSSGTLETTTAMINGVWDFLPNATWHPFIGAGIGAAYINATDITRESAPDYGGHDVRFAYQGFAGLGYDLTPQWQAKFQYKYSGASDYHVAAYDGSKGDAEYGGHALLAGISYKFGEPAKSYADTTDAVMPLRNDVQSEGNATAGTTQSAGVGEANRRDGDGGRVPSGHAAGITLESASIPNVDEVDSAAAAKAESVRSADGTATPEGAAGDAPKEPEDWSFHGQYTLTEQMHPYFRSPNFSGGNGTNAINNKFQSRETQSMTAYAAYRIADGTELYVDPEAFEGYGLSGSLGMGDLTNGEAQKVGSVQAKVYMARYYLKQTFGLGGEQEWMEGGVHQLAGWQDVSRLTVIAGGFALNDFFGGNAYANDPRHDFDNWGIIQGAAWDWAANARAYTGGVYAELNQKDWALRWAGVLQPMTPGGMVVYNHGGADNIDHNVELESRYQIDDHPGKLRLLGFLNQGNMGSYSQINSLVAQGMDIGSATALSRSEWGKTKIGYMLNLEQEVANEIGVFARWSWNDGTTEEWNYTDADASLSGGVSVKGGRWGRSNDAFGVGLVNSTISGQHQLFLANGGQGMMLGEGSLPKYDDERAFETYYAAKIFDPLTVTADYQLVQNPGYDPTRGPVHVFGVRGHVEF